MLAKLLALLEAGEADKFAASSLPIAQAIRATEQGQQGYRARGYLKLPGRQRLGFNDDYRQWEHLLRIHE